MNEALYLVGFAAAWTVAILYDNHNEVVKVEHRAQVAIAAAEAQRAPASCVRAALVASRDEPSNGATVAAIETTLKSTAFAADEATHTARAVR